jgi:uncharacterized glyoxalase superfamily protein PhnB
VKTLTPVIFVDKVEPCLGFWEGLGFQRTMEVPEEDGLGFAAMASGGVEVMYQSRAGLAKDLPDLADMQFGPSNFFIRVADLNSIKPTLEAGDVVVPERKTFYGAREIVVRAPCGTIATFAEFEE